MAQMKYNPTTMQWEEIDTGRAVEMEPRRLRRTSRFHGGNPTDKKKARFARHEQDDGLPTIDSSILWRPA